MQLNIISKPKEALYIRRNNSKVDSIDRGRIIIAYFRGGSKTAATSKMERFVIIFNGFQPLTIITKRSILDVAAVLDPPLHLIS